jgi:L-2-hydroxyglutarate oxidase
MDADFLIVGAGIVGLATARALQRAVPGALVGVLEKEDRPARHQSGRNSGVIHSGLYYSPGSQKARLCREGRDRMVSYCAARGIPHAVTGKLVVATTPEEQERLDELHRRGSANGLRGIRRLGSEEIQEFEPWCRGVSALHVPQAGVADFAAVVAALQEEIEDEGGFVVFRTPLRRAERSGARVRVFAGEGTLETGFLVNCGGLYSDVIARRCGLDPGLRIVPFRGEYVELVPEKRDRVNTAIYPVPDPRFPFLGVHFTRTVAGVVEAGPNAVLAFAREGYTQDTVDVRELLDTLLYPGFLRMALRDFRAGVNEMARSTIRFLFLRSMRKLIPDIDSEDFVSTRSGVRAQAVDRAGKMVDDFRFARAERMLHVLNAPSPAATASLAIGEEIARQVLSSRP